MQESEQQKQYIPLRLKCQCNCGAQIQIQNAGNGEIMIDTRINGRYRWVGVVLNKDQIKSISHFLKD